VKTTVCVETTLLSLEKASYHKLNFTEPVFLLTKIAASILQGKFVTIILSFQCENTRFSILQKSHSFV
jgi:hypothetical protein